VELEVVVTKEEVYSSNQEEEQIEIKYNQTDEEGSVSSK